MAFLTLLIEAGGERRASERASERTTTMQLLTLFTFPLRPLCLHEQTRETR